ncbi:MAG: transketolase-like TK C-terminal-containing protein, partial [Tepidiformaceae bacterium]
QSRMDAYAADFPAEAATLRQLISSKLPENWTSALPSFSSADGAMATRKSSGKALTALMPVLPGLLGGSGDLAPSNDTFVKGYGALGNDGWDGRNMHFGVREHAMGSIINGLALHGGLLPYGGTFFCFSDYMRPAIRLAALEQAHSIFVFTHDSIGLGEDGPTHQPIEQMASLRAMPGLRVIRPGDANETVAAWKVAIESPGPSALVLTRQDIPTWDDGKRLQQGLEHGAYVFSDPPDGRPQIILIGTGSELQLAVGARDLLAKDGVAARVVSMPCWELFAAESREYRDSVLPPEVRARVAVEAGATFGWERYIGDDGDVVGIDHFGASAPGPVVMEKFGFTAENVAGRAKALLGRLSEKAR